MTWMSTQAALARRLGLGDAEGPEQRRFPRWLQLVGCAGCLVLVVTLPWEAVVAGLAVFAVFAVGVVYRLVLVRN